CLPVIFCSTQLIPYTLGRQTGTTVHVPVRDDRLGRGCSASRRYRGRQSVARLEDFGQRRRIPAPVLVVGPEDGLFQLHAVKLTGADKKVSLTTHQRRVPFVDNVEVSRLPEALVIQALQTVDRQKVIR